MKIIIGLLRKILAMLENQASEMQDAREAEPEALRNQVDDLSKQLEIAKEELGEKNSTIESLNDELAASAENLELEKRQLEKAKQEISKKDLKLEQAGIKLNTANQEAESLRAALLPDQERLLALQKLLASIAPPFREVASMYFRLDSVPVFLAQCGQFSNLRDCWKSCHELVAAGANPGNIAAFLESCVSVYNAAFPNLPCMLLAASPGEEFDYEKQERLGPRGGKVAEMLLPGLLRPNGDLACKCLVRLE